MIAPKCTAHYGGVALESTKLAPDAQSCAIRAVREWIAAGRLHYPESGTYKIDVHVEGYGTCKIAYGWIKSIYCTGSRRDA